MRTENKQLKRTARVHTRRRHLPGFPHYSIEQSLQIGMEHLKSLDDLRQRSGLMYEDDKLWTLAEHWYETRKAQDAALAAIDKHMRSTYGKNGHRFRIERNPTGKGK